MKHHNVRAIVLKRIDYGEADRILTLLTDTQGIVSAIAKGTRKLNSKLAGGIEPLAINQISLIAGKSEMFTVTSARAEVFYRQIIADYDTTQAAFGIMKTAGRIHLIENEPWLFELVASSLKSLDSGIDADLTKLWAALTMLSQLGHLPDLSQDENSNQLSEATTYRLDYAHGTLSRGGALKSSHIKLWRLCEQYKPEQLSKINGALQAAKESVQFAEQALTYVLN